MVTTTATKVMTWFQGVCVLAGATLDNMGFSFTKLRLEKDIDPAQENYLMAKKENTYEDRGR